MAEATTARPQTRGDCANGPRPCPWVSCKHHLLLEVSEKTGHIRYNWDPDRLEQMPHTCALDVADLGAHSEEEIAQLMGLTQTGISAVSRRGTERAREAAKVIRLPVVAA